VRDDLDPKKVAVKSDAPAFAVRTDPPGERAFRIIVDWSGKGENPPTETVIHISVGADKIDLPVRVNKSRVGTGS
jgi:hypothetical protein